MDHEKPPPGQAAARQPVIQRSASCRRDLQMRRPFNRPDRRDRRHRRVCPRCARRERRRCLSRQTKVAIGKTLTGNPGNARESTT